MTAARARPRVGFVGLSLWWRLLRVELVQAACAVLLATRSLLLSLALTSTGRSWTTRVSHATEMQVRCFDATSFACTFTHKATIQYMRITSSLSRHARACQNDVCVRTLMAGLASEALWLAGSIELRSGWSRNCSCWSRWILLGRSGHGFCGCQWCSCCCWLAR